MVRILIAISILFSTTAGYGQEARLRLLLAGDSTVQDADHRTTPDWGWGQVLPRFFDDGVEVVNLARGGRSTRSFIDEGRWDELLSLTRPGDFVFIQFGHNDPKEGERFSSPADYGRNLARFVADIRAKGATPVLFTPVSRRRFESEGNLEFTHGDYPGVVHDVAESSGTLLIDLKTKTRRLLMEHGPEGSKRIFLHFGPGEYSRRPEGLEDNTHFSEYGAMRVAGIVVREVMSLGLSPLCEHIAEVPVP